MQEYFLNAFVSPENGWKEVDSETLTGFILIIRFCACEY